MIPVVPSVIDKTNKYERNYDIYSRLLKDRVIMLDGEVRDELTTIIVAQLLFLEAENPGKPIWMYINSPGGSVSAGMAIIDVMDIITSPVYTVCLGSAASMGAMLTLCGERGHRYGTRHSRIMVHQVSAGCSGRVSDMEVTVEEARAVNEVLFRVIIERTGRSAKEVRKAMAKDTWFDVHKAIEFGLIDEVMERK